MKIEAKHSAPAGIQANQNRSTLKLTILALFLLTCLAMFSSCSPKHCPVMQINLNTILF
ncbi:MAG: hypothetical protein PSX81_04195 [bacterium]|nr:hypothetical protein [bacterium]